MVISALTVNAESPTIAYSYSNSKRGFAEGTITVDSKGNSGTYYLYWADDTKALQGYREIASIDLSSGGSGKYKMPAQTVIPADAKKLIAVKSSSKPIGATIGRKSFSSKSNKIFAFTSLISPTKPISLPSAYFLST